VTDTRVADILDALYNLWAADATLAAAVTAGTLKIFDGPPTIDFSARDMLCIGGLPVDDDDSETSVNLDWGSLGRSGQYADVDESIAVPCGIVSQLGDSTAAGMRACRRNAINVYAAAASALRASTLGIDVVMWCLAGVTGIRQAQTQNGAECLIAFTALVRTRI
jgi:hypothetical protein